MNPLPPRRYIDASGPLAHHNPGGLLTFVFSKAYLTYKKMEASAYISFIDISIILIIQVCFVF